MIFVYLLVLTFQQDDGSHSVACERCNVWQHSKCLGITQHEAEKEDFHFICRDCKRREEEAKRPKLPPLKFRIGTSASPSTPAADPAVIKGEEDQSPSAKKVNFDGVDAAGATGPSIQSQVSAQKSGPSQPNGLHAVNPPPSPQRRSQPIVNGSSNPLSGFSAPPSPSKAAGLASSPAGHLPKHIVNQYTPHQHASQRPSSSHSTHSQAVPSPIQNRPSMSPTQGNRDVGPLAGFPPSAVSNGSMPSTPFGQHQTPRPQNAGLPSFSSSFDRRPSFSSASGVVDSFSHTPPPQGSQGIPLSGLSPTKNSPRPMTSGSVGSASVLPPIHRLEPSPKLMGRSSPDAPIPPPVKLMTPEQEERRQRENEMAANGQHQSLARSSLSSLTSWDIPAAQQQQSTQGAGQPVQDGQGINGP
jgi:hypothetical protein